MIFTSCDPLKFTLRYLSICLFLALIASSASAGTVSGTVSNGTTGKPASGVEVILIQLQGGMQPVANTKTDSQGHYSFDNPTLGTAPMLLRAVYRGVNYHEPITPGKATVDVQVFEPTEKPGSFAVTAHAIIFQPNGSDLVVGEEYNVSNKTQPPLAYYRANGSFLLDRKSTRLNSSHLVISYAVFCLKKKNTCAFSQPVRRGPLHPAPPTSR